MYYCQLMIKRFQEDLCGLVHVAGWDPYDLHNLAHAPGIGSVSHPYLPILHNIYIS